MNSLYFILGLFLYPPPEKSETGYLNAIERFGWGQGRRWESSLRMVREIEEFRQEEFSSSQGLR